MMTILAKDAVATLVSLFERQVARTPDAAALIDGAAEVSFRQLDALARRAAVRLRQSGIGPGDRVGHCFRRSVDAIAAMAAILKVGAAYVPIAVDSPAPRRDFMLRDSGAKGVLCGADFAPSLASCPVPVLPWPETQAPLREDGERLPDPNLGPASAAWVMYTSGSSGQPKGVVGTHRGCVARIRALWERQPFAEDERCFGHTAFTTVDSFWEIFAPLCAGHALHVVGDDLIKDPERLMPHLAKLGIRRITMVPSLLALLVDLFPSLSAVVPDLKLWVVSGEPLTLDLCARFRGATRGARLFNQYGMTESCADVTSFDATDAGTTPVSDAFRTCLYAPIGRPFAGAELLVVDERQIPVRDGTAGELCIAGECLSDGYLNRPELTAERFFTLPCEGTAPAGRALRTGDRAVRLPDGELLYLGRIDSQINLRGYRIEPGEVEAAIAAHEDVVQAAVVLQETDALRKQLVAFVTLRPAARAAMSPDIRAELKRGAEGRLPAYMVPHAFVVVDSMPLTPSGKIDRRAISAAVLPPRAAASHVIARQGTESAVAEVFAAVLKLDRIGATDNFFDMGGNSLTAMQVVSGLRARLEVDIPMSLVFEALTVQSLAGRIDEMEAEERPRRARIAARPSTEFRPMSPSQERLWFFERLRPGTATYTISWNLRMRGPLERSALARSLAEIVKRHEVLRTRFDEVDGRGAQIVGDGPAVLVDVRCADEDELAARLDACSNVSFDLDRGPLHRFTLFELDPEDHCLSIAVHHAVSDGWSMQVIGQELCALYASFAQELPSPLAPLEAQFADYARWQRERLDERRLEDLAAYWRGQLAGAPAALELPTDRPRPAVASHRGGHVPFALSAEASQALRGLARREGVTLFMVMLGALDVVLSRWCGQRDIVVGSPIAARSQRETEPMIGFFVNTLALRTDLSGDPSFAELLQRVRRTALGAYAHQELPFDRLVEILQPERDLSRHPVFQAMLALHPEPAAASMPGLRTRAWDGRSATAKFDLTLELVDAASGIEGAIEFASDLWDAGTARRFADHVRNVLADAVRSAATRLSALAMMGEEETRALVGTGVGIAEPFSPEHAVAELFARQAALTPHATALRQGGVALSYAELDGRVDRLAAHLQELGVGPDALVGLCIPRSIDMVVGMLAILKAGGAYVPIDPEYPVDRIAYMLGDAAIAVLVTQSAIARKLPDGAAPRVLIDTDWTRIAAATRRVARHALDGDHLAYVIYTSGTTGRPKGVMVHQRGLANLMQWFTRDVGIGANDAVLLVSSHSFDLTQKNIFGPLTTGGSLHLAAEPFDPLGIVQQVQREAITFINCTPSAFYALVEAGDARQLRSLRRVMLGGEPIQAAKLMQMPEPRPEFINSYGPTECSDVDVYHALSSELDRYRTGVPLGLAVRNTHLYVLDEHRRPVPQGVVGELYIAGVGVARGYLNRPALTAERFVPSPFGEGARMYRTGDLVRWNAEGLLDYLGRVDHQVKLRGFRIETGEIEAALLECPLVQQAFVMARDDHRGQLQLVAYVVGDASLRDDSILRRHLQAALPEPMIPAVFVKMDQIPLSPNGKVDRAALPAPALPSSVGEYAAPRPGLEEAVAKIFADVLQLDRVSAEDNFFHLGGHSLLAMRVVAGLRKSLGRELPLKDLFAHPSVRLVARRLESIAAEEQAPALSLGERAGPMPLSFAQERLWFLDRLGIGRTTYNVPWMLHMKGAVDVPALERAISEVLRRHEALRTRFVDRDGRPEQVIDAPTPFSLAVRAVSPEQLEDGLQALAEQGFDLAAGPLCKFELLSTGADDFQLCLVAHHIVCDGWSIDLLAGELCDLYQAFTHGRPSPLPALAAQYADYARWQREWLDDKRVDEQLAYWCAQLGGAPAALELPTDRPRPAEASHRGGHVSFALPAETAQALQALAQREGATLFMVLLASLNVVLGRWSGQDDIVVGSPIAGRGRRETEPMIGFFVNTLALRTDLSGNPTFAELLQRVRHAALDAYAHQDLPFEKLVEALQPVRDLSRQAIFQVMLTANTPRQSLSIPGLTLAARGGRTSTAKFDLSVEVGVHEGQLQAGLAYATDLFDHGTIERLGQHFRRVLELAATQPDCPIGRLPVLSPAERDQQFVAWNRRQADYAGAQDGLHQLVERQALRRPQAVALVHDGRVLHYDALNRRANQLAHHLRERGIGAGSLVAVRLHAGHELAVAFLGTLKSGAACMPLDPSQPREEQGVLLRHSAARILLTTQALLERMDEPGLPALCLEREAATLAARPQHDPGLPVHPDQLACCADVSGPGRPRIATITHRAIVNQLLWLQEHHRIEAGETVLRQAAYACDTSMLDFFTPLAAGARLVIAPNEQHTQLHDLDQLMREYGAATVQFGPTMLQAFLAPGREASPALRRVFACGELPPASVRRQFRRRHPQVALHFLRGAMDGALDGSHWTSADDGVLVGQPAADTRWYVLDANLQPVPVGATAELYIAGLQLTSGYLYQPDAAAQRLVPDPHGEPGSRMLRTGDLVRHRADGSIVHVGRADRRVKVNGQRIDLGDIESALLESPDVRECAVALSDDGQPQLAAYVVARETALDVAELRKRLNARLPDSSMPAAWMELPSLPRDAQGRLDRKALPAPLVLARDAVDDEPATDTQKLVASIWSELFGVERVGLHDNFFELGGHSLMAVQTLWMVEQRAGLQVPIRALFEAHTVLQLAERIDELRQPAEHPAAGTQPNLLRLRQGTSPTTLVMLHPGGGGGTVAAYRALLDLVQGDATVYALNAIDFDGRSIPGSSVREIASRYLDQLHAGAGEGPFCLIGWSAGGLIAYEMAHQMTAAGRPPQMLALIDTTPLRRDVISEETGRAEFSRFLRFVGWLDDAPPGPDAAEGAESPVPAAQWLDRLHEAVSASPNANAALSRENLSYVHEVFRALQLAYASYDAPAYGDKVELFVPTPHDPSRVAYWHGRVGTVTMTITRGDHYSMLELPHVESIASAIKTRLQEIADARRGQG
jgi:amino acid adenylation domain-containing protein